VHRRLREFYYRPCHVASYMLDPVHFIRDKARTSKVHLPKSNLTSVECQDALDDVERLGGEDAKKELIQLTNAGFEPRDVFEIAALDAAVPMGGEVGATLPHRVQRKAAWEAIGNQYPHLKNVAFKYLAQHTSSCASERNLSKFGRLFHKCRNRFKLEKAARIVFIASSEVLSKELKSDEERLFDDLESLYDVYEVDGVVDVTGSADDTDK
jgi:hypothetical protein